METEFSNTQLRETTKDELIELVLTLQSENKKLRKALEESQRLDKRQASPFSKGTPKVNPKRPGRKSGKKHGNHHRREIPKSVDREIYVPIKTGLMNQDGNPLCPDCHEMLDDYETHSQYQTDIPPAPKPIVTKFNIEVARCPCCDQRFQGRHEEQTSDALHAANSQLGPRILGLAAELKYGFGLKKYRNIFTGIMICKSQDRQYADLRNGWRKKDWQAMKN
jgi:transposase